MDTIDTIRTLRAGDATLRVRTVYDSDPDASFYGKLADWRNVPYDAYVYDRQTGLMAGPEVIINGEYVRQWRDDRGRIEANDTDDTYSREYRYIVANDDNYKGLPSRDIYRYCKQDAKRLDALYRDEWSFIGIVATVHVEGREIGHSSVWGCEADWNTDITREYRDVIRDVTREALNEAQGFRAKISKASSKQKEASLT